MNPQELEDVWTAVTAVMDRLDQRDAVIAQLQNQLTDANAQISRLTAARAEMTTRLDDQAQQIEATADRIEAHAVETANRIDAAVDVERQARGLLSGHVDGIAGRVGAFEACFNTAITRLDGINVEIQRVDAAAGELKSLVLENRAGVQDLRASVDTVGEHVSDAHRQIKQHREQTNARCLDIIENMDGLKTTVQENTDWTRAKCDHLTELVAEASEVVGSYATETSEQMTAIADAISEANEHIRRVTSQLPRTLMVNRDGDLVAINGEGDAERIARVCGEPGRDAATVANAEIVNGSLKIHMSDGRSIDAGSILPPTPSKPAPTGELTPEKVVDLIENKRQSRTRIAKDHGTT